MSEKKRRATLYQPIWAGPIEGYVVNSLKRHFWRIQSSMEYKDALQEAYVVFLKLEAKYGVLDTPAHFMALFKTSWERHLNDLARRDADNRAMVLDSQRDDGEAESWSLLDALAGDLDTDGYLLTLIKQAPPDITTVLSFFLNAPQELVEQASSAWREAGHRREHGDKMLSQMLGLPPGITSRVAEYLSR